MAARSPSVLVVGGGVVGCSIAYYLTRRDLDVALIDAGFCPSSTTRASLGVLTHFNGGDNPYSAFYRDGHSSYPQLAEELRSETGLDIGWRAPGGIDLIFTDEDEQEAAELLRFNKERGCPAELVDGAGLRELEPRVSSRARGGLYFPGDHRVDPAGVSQALLCAAAQRGARISQGEALETIVQATDEGVIVGTSSGTREADFLVLAAGSWTRSLGELLGARIPVRPIRGQHGRFAGGDAARHILRYGGRHVVPDGSRLIVGSTVEEVDFEANTTSEAARSFETVCGEVLELKPELLEQRAGLRPKPKGGRPLIGPLNEYPRVFAATGHYKNGVLLGPVTGQVVSEWIAEGRPSRDMGRFGVER